MNTSTKGSLHAIACVCMCGLCLLRLAIGYISLPTVTLDAPVITFKPIMACIDVFKTTYCRYNPFICFKLEFGNNLSPCIHTMDWCGMVLHQLVEWSGSRLHYLAQDCIACVGHQRAIDVISLKNVKRLQFIDRKSTANVLENTHKFR